MSTNFMFTIVEFLNKHRDCSQLDRVRSLLSSHLNFAAVTVPTPLQLQIKGQRSYWFMLWDGRLLSGNSLNILHDNFSNWSTDMIDKVNSGEVSISSYRKQHVFQLCIPDIGFWPYASATEFEIIFCGGTDEYRKTWMHRRWLLPETTQDSWIVALKPKHQLSDMEGKDISNSIFFVDTILNIAGEDLDAPAIAPDRYCALTIRTIE